jgi:hypothetical protein
VGTTATIRDGRLTLTRRAALGARTPGPVPEASIRATEPVRAAMATSPLRVAALAAALTHRFPGAAPDRVRTLLGQLLDEGSSSPTCTRR